jgi:hypothetical protein
VCSAEGLTAARGEATGGCGGVGWRGGWCECLGVLVEGQGGARSSGKAEGDA